MAQRSTKMKRTIKLRGWLCYCASVYARVCCVCVKRMLAGHIIPTMGAAAPEVLVPLIFFEPHTKHNNETLLPTSKGNFRLVSNAFFRSISLQENCIQPIQ